jgi:hypothetical protein
MCAGCDRATVHLAMAGELLNPNSEVGLFKQLMGLDGASRHEETGSYSSVRSPDAAHASSKKSQLGSRGAWDNFKDRNVWILLK